jgi:hypothetical protein
LREPRVGVDPVAVGMMDAVAARVAGTVYLHKVTALDGRRVQIGNNRGRINGWTGREKVFGRCVEMDGEAFG